MRIVVVGATGRTGTRLVDLALEHGHEVVAFVRDLEDLAVDHERVTMAVGDAYTGTGLEAAVEGADAVVSVIGHRSGSPSDLLTVAGEEILAACAVAGVDRFVTLVSADVLVEAGGQTLTDRIVRRANALFDHDEVAVSDARTHVEHVVRSDCRWTVVRAVRLTDVSPTDEYDHGSLDVREDDAVGRDDVADLLLTVVEEDLYVRELPFVLGTRAPTGGTDAGRRKRSERDAGQDDRREE